MDIIEYFSCDDKAHWLGEIKKSDWAAGKFLYQLLCEDRLRELCGDKTRLFLLTDKDKLVSFCTYAEQDEIRQTPLTPWIGFVYTFPEYRGHKYMGKLIDHIHLTARSEGYEHIYISTDTTGLYEKYGYTFMTYMKGMNGDDCRVYRTDIR